MNGTSETAQKERTQAEREEEREPENAVASPPGEGEARDTGGHDKIPPATESPPTAPTNSPWWTAPGGKPVDIPDFGHVL